MVWKIYAYVGLCFGFWTDELVEMFEIHQHVRKFTCAYLDPHVKRRMFLRANGVYLEEQNDFLTSTEEFERTQRDIKEICGPIAKKTLKDDYASCLHALLAPRATLAQLIPFGAFLTIYVSNTARYPCFSSSEQLNESLFPLIVKDPFDDCREDDQMYLDELYEIRKAEVHIGSRDIIEVDGDDQDPKRLERVRELNAASHQKFDRLFSETKLEAQEWVVTIKGLQKYVFKSRLINYMYSLAMFIIQVLLVFLPVQYHKKLIYVAVIIILPFSMVKSLALVSQFGWQTFRITDEELAHELLWFLCMFKSVVSGVKSLFGFDSVRDGSTTGDMELAEMSAAGALGGASEGAREDSDPHDHTFTPSTENPLHSRGQ
jgi:hypothetical protein